MKPEAYGWSGPRRSSPVAAATLGLDERHGPDPALADDIQRLPLLRARDLTDPCSDPAVCAAFGVSGGESGLRRASGACAWAASGSSPATPSLQPLRQLQHLLNGGLGRSAIQQAEDETALLMHAWR